MVGVGVGVGVGIDIGIGVGVAVGFRVFKVFITRIILPLLTHILSPQSGGFVFHECKKLPFTIENKNEGVRSVSRINIEQFTN